MVLFFRIKLNKVLGHCSQGEFDNDIVGTFKLTIYHNVLPDFGGANAGIEKRGLCRFSRSEQIVWADNIFNGGGVMKRINGIIVVYFLFINACF